MRRQERSDGPARESLSFAALAVVLAMLSEPRRGRAAVRRGDMASEMTYQPDEQMPFVCRQQGPGGLPMMGKSA